MAFPRKKIVGQRDIDRRGQCSNKEAACLWGCRVIPGGGAKGRSSRGPESIAPGEWISPGGTPLRRASRNDGEHGKCELGRVLLRPRRDTRTRCGLAKAADT